MSKFMEKKYSMHRLPTNVEKRQKWINIGIDLDLTKVYFICETHFAIEMWEKPRIDGKKKLRSTAVPTIVKHKTENNIRITNHENLSHNMILKEIEDINEPCIQNVDGIHEEIHKDVKEKVENSISEAAISVSLPFEAVDIEKVLKKTEETKIKLEKANVSINKLDKSNKILQKRVKRLICEKRNLAVENEILKQSKNFSKILNTDQIKALNLRYVRGHEWPNNTIKKALRLRLLCGNSGYQKLISQGIPLPSGRTLRRRLQDFDFKPGISDQIFDILKQRVSQSTDDREKDCMLAVDEMSLMSGEQIDQSTMSYIGLSTLPDTCGNYPTYPI
ncbi:uncharacterized protein LOC109860424 [Pseudomyrmex gracilis]|uniref:uncharacterized protein LOC109860424 n=1 Tax=Pseudomyrmex gracilis TaxID=219809 RepID=UPI000994957B|nr:uncharacterized protein LOC109860424 [Pseudomyrmex gracilis]